MPEQAHLRVHGYGDIEVELVIQYLSDLKHAYESLIVFETTIDGIRRTYRELPFQNPFILGLGWPLASRRALRYIRDWPPTRAEIASLVPISEQLVLTGVNVSSPGFWEFLGSVNPFEVIRKALNDRHERRKDREYRESAEKRRLELENFERETQVIADRIRLAKEIGATETDLTPLLRELVHKPILALDRYQDKGIIEQAEVVRLRDHR
jgi:hypothetical protein